MSEHLLRPITNDATFGGEPRLSQPFEEPTRQVRLEIEKSGGKLAGVWWPWTVNYAAEVHDLVHDAGKKLGGKVDRIAFEWNAASMSSRRLMTPDDLTLTGPESGQPRGEMRVYAANGALLRVTLVPPPKGRSRRHSMQ